MSLYAWEDYERDHPPTEEEQRYLYALHCAAFAGELVLAARAAAGITQAELAERLGTSQPTIARWEGGRQIPSVRTLVRVAKATGFDLVLGLRTPGPDGRDVATGVFDPDAVATLASEKRPSGLGPGADLR